MIDAVVVGGGPAGAALATRLAQAGREVVLVEREALPADKVCGEFLSREAGHYLSLLGLCLPALGAVPIDALRLCEGGRVATVALPFAAWSLSRRVLDEALLARAAEAGATIRRGAKVERLEPSGAGFRARLGDGAAIDAGAAFLATGKHDLRGFKRPAGLQDDLVAFKQHFHLSREQTAELSRHVELVLFEGGYAGLSLVEEGRANLCLVVRRRRFAELGQRWDRLLAAMRAGSPHLDTRLAGSSPCGPRPLALSAIPYGHVRRRSTGIWHLGDQAAVIPSFSGDGMSIALHSAELAARAFLAGIARGRVPAPARARRDRPGAALHRSLARARAAAGAGTARRGGASGARPHGSGGLAHPRVRRGARPGRARGCPMTAPDSRAARPGGVVKTSAGDHDGFARLPDGGEIAYQIRGRVHGGTPLLLVRPLGGSTALWGSFRTVLSEKLEVISFYYRGSGHSTQAPAWVTTKGLARDGLGVLDHLGATRAHVFGISLGGMAATWLALLAPARVAKLCLAATPARGIELTHTALRRDLALAACFARPLPEVEAHLVDRILSRRFREGHPEEVRRIERALHAQPATRTALIKHAVAAFLHDARRELHRIHAPTLVLAGQDDELLGTGPPRALAAAIPGAMFEIIAASGHDVTLEQPIAAATRVARFLVEPVVSPS